MNSIFSTSSGENKKHQTLAVIFFITISPQTDKNPCSTYLKISLLLKSESNPHSTILNEMKQATMHWSSAEKGAYWQSLVFCKTFHFCNSTCLAPAGWLNHWSVRKPIFLIKYSNSLHTRREYTSVLQLSWLATQLSIRNYFHAQSLSSPLKTNKNSANTFPIR